MAHALAGVSLANLKGVEAADGSYYVRLCFGSPVLVGADVEYLDGMVEGAENDRSAFRDLDCRTEALLAPGGIESRKTLMRFVSASARPAPRKIGWAMCR